MLPGQTMATAWLYPDHSSVTRVSEPDHIRHPQDLPCPLCGRTYALHYERAFTKRSPAVQSDLLNKFQGMVTAEHARGHRQPYLCVGTEA
jgi:hypothetical protein